MSRRVLRVEFTDTPMCAYVRGYGSRELLTELKGRPPVWATLHKAWAVTERTARDLLAVAESRGMPTEVSREAA